SVLTLIKMLNRTIPRIEGPLPMNGCHMEQSTHFFLIMDLAVFAGINGSAIENFSCVIYDISLMNCTWQAGRNAPGGTQYFLYWQNSRDDDQTECELYTKDENDRNVGCKFQNVTIKGKTTYFLVNGSHKTFLIQFYDNYTKLYTIERLPPPLNVTANCTSNPGGCIITWQQPLLSHVENRNCFQYEIDIQNEVKTMYWFAFGTISSYMYLNNMQISILSLLTSI
uniref:Type I cytokine receptor cytokine-binding domain-containing protein n=1 Tax=Pavo cristatus TaxID=9049 RepID=A0A8C9FDQ9_PAVCR